MYKPESKISPSQADDIIMGGADAKDMPGYRRVSTHELRALYGTWMNHDNMHMPVAQYMGMMLDVMRSITSYKGMHVCKNPLDSWIFHEIISERKPNIIIEIGNQAGGSTVMLRDFLMNNEIEGSKYVIGIDIDRSRLSVKALNCLGIKWITGDNRSKDVLEKVHSLVTADDRVMVIDDSSHEYAGTLAVLEKYGPLVSKGQYFIVEDTAIGAFIPFGNTRQRAYDAVQKFMDGNNDFRIDRTREKWFITLNLEGYLEKIR